MFITLMVICIASFIISSISVSVACVGANNKFRHNFVVTLLRHTEADWCPDANRAGWLPCFIHGIWIKLQSFIYSNADKRPARLYEYICQTQHYIKTRLILKYNNTYSLSYIMHFLSFWLAGVLLLWMCLKIILNTLRVICFALHDEFN